MAAEKPPMPVGFCKAAATGRYGPTTWVNVFYFDVSAGSHTTAEVLAEVADAVHDFYNDIFTPAGMPSTWTLDYITCTYRDAEDSTVKLRIADAVAGTNTTGSQDAQVCYLINWQTGDPRRGGKPRQYLTGVVDSSCADSARLDSAYQGVVNGRLVTWLTANPLRSPALVLSEVSFRNDKTWRDAAIAWAIFGGTINPVVANQRRRVDRLRPH